MALIQRPLNSELADYQQHYVSLAQDDVFLQLHNQCTQLEEIIMQLTEEQLDYAYAPKKWTLKQNLIHLLDSEQIFAYRALAISRGEKQVLPGFDQDEYMDNTDFSHITKADLLRELCTVRDATISLFSTMNSAQMERIGQVSNYYNTTRAILFVIAGHCQHHINILHERYLK